MDHTLFIYACIATVCSVGGFAALIYVINKVLP